MIKIDVELEAIPFKRVLTHGKRRYNDERYTLFKEILGHLAKVAMRGKEPLSGEIKMKVTFKKPRKVTDRRYGDLDNLIKSVLDALTGICYKDDSQVTRLTALKKNGAARIIIILEELK